MKRITSSFASPVGLAGLFVVCGCSTLIGADFDRELLEDEEASTGGATGTGATNGAGGEVNTSGGASSTGGSAVGGSASGGAASGGSATGGAASGGSGGAGTGGTFVDGSLRINEIYSYGPDFIEIYNDGTTTEDLTGFAVVQGDVETGPRFPAAGLPSTQLVPGGRYVFDVDFDIDQPALYLLVDGSDVVVAGLAFPSSAGITIGSSWSRLPDGGSSLAWNVETRGAPNE